MVRRGVGTRGVGCRGCVLEVVVVEEEEEAVSRTSGLGQRWEWDSVMALGAAAAAAALGGCKGVVVVGPLIFFRSVAGRNLWLEHGCASQVKVVNLGRASWVSLLGKTMRNVLLSF